MIDEELKQELKELKDLMRICNQLIKQYGKQLDNSTKELLKETANEMKLDLYQEFYTVVREEIKNKENNQ